MSGDGAGVGLVMPGPVSEQRKMLDPQTVVTPAAAAPQGPESMSRDLQAPPDTCAEHGVNWLDRCILMPTHVCACNIVQVTTEKYSTKAAASHQRQNAQSKA